MIDGVVHFTPYRPFNQAEHTEQKHLVTCPTCKQLIIHYDRINNDQG